MIDALNPDRSKAPTRVTKAHYLAYKRALLSCIPKRSEGIRFMDLTDLVAERLPTETLQATKPMWWVTTVKLDLEARGLIERVPGKSPQRLRRI